MTRMLKLGLMVSAAALAAAALAPVWPNVTAADGPAAAGQEPIRIQVNLVNLFATVRDKKTKQILTGLEQSDI